MASAGEPQTVKDKPLKRDGPSTGEGLLKIPVDRSVTSAEMRSEVVHVTRKYLDCLGFPSHAALIQPAIAEAHLESGRFAAAP